jgi:hypothetical protein
VSQWLNTIAEVSEIGKERRGEREGDEGYCSQRFEGERNQLERALREERERGDALRPMVEGLKEEVGREKEEKGKWVERCDEAEGAKERLLVLVNKRGKELVKSGREAERLEGLLRDLEEKMEGEKRAREEERVTQLKVVEELREKLEEQCRVSKQFLDSLEEVRAAKADLVRATEVLKEQLTTEKQASKQRRQALDEN